MAVNLDEERSAGAESRGTRDEAVAIAVGRARDQHTQAILGTLARLERRRDRSWSSMALRDSSRRWCSQGCSKSKKIVSVAELQGAEDGPCATPNQRALSTDMVEPIGGRGRPLSPCSPLPRNLFGRAQRKAGETRHLARDRSPKTSNHRFPSLETARDTTRLCIPRHQRASISNGSPSTSLAPPH